MKLLEILTEAKDMFMDFASTRSKGANKIATPAPTATPTA